MASNLKIRNLGWENSDKSQCEIEKFDIYVKG